MNIIYSDRFLEYKEQGHPESPGRLVAIVNFLRKKGIDDFIEPVPCSEEDLLFVHTEEMVRKIKENDFFEPDTPNVPGIYEYALLSCGSAIIACEIALSGKPAFSLARPPGHHAGKHFPTGFCYFNNMAVSVKKMLLAGKKVAILDIDGHHGNGTEEILKDEDKVIYVSIHQSPAYPGTGIRSFGNCFNFPVSPGLNSKKYLEKFNEAIAIVRDFTPDVIGISLGFYAHFQDPLLQLPLRDSDYYSIGKEIGKLETKFFVILEGGYNTLTLGNTCYCFIKGIEG